RALDQRFAGDDAPGTDRARNKCSAILNDRTLRRNTSPQVAAGCGLSCLARRTIIVQSHVRTKLVHQLPPDDACDWQRNEPGESWHCDQFLLHDFPPETKCSVGKTSATRISLGARRIIFSGVIKRCQRCVK